MEQEQTLNELLQVQRFRHATKILVHGLPVTDIIHGMRGHQCAIDIEYPELCWRVVVEDGFHCLAVRW